MLDISHLPSLRTHLVDYDILQITPVRNVLLSMGYPHPMEVEWRAIIDSFYGTPSEVSQLERLIIRVLTGSSPETTRHTVPAIFWSDADLFDQFVINLARSKNRSRQIYSDTATLRNLMQRAGAFVGWLPLDYEIGMDGHAECDDKWVGKVTECSVFGWEGWSDKVVWFNHDVILGGTTSFSSFGTTPCSPLDAHSSDSVSVELVPEPSTPTRPTSWMNVDPPTLLGFMDEDEDSHMSPPKLPSPPPSPTPPSKRAREEYATLLGTALHPRHSIPFPYIKPAVSPSVLLPRDKGKGKVMVTPKPPAPPTPMASSSSTAADMGDSPGSPTPKFKHKKLRVKGRRSTPRTTTFVTIPGQVVLSEDEKEHYSLGFSSGEWSHLGR